jgi:hypothetical protein
LKKTDVFGNNPRKISLTNNDEHLLNRIRLAVCSDSLKNFLSKTVNVDELLHRNAADAIHRLFFITSDSDFGCPSLVFVSSYVQCLISRYLDFLKLTSACDNYQSSLLTRNPSLVGINYETCFHTYFNQLLPQGCNVNFQYIIECKNKKFQFVPFESVCTFYAKFYKRTDDINVGSLPNECYCSPIMFNFSTFDSVYKGKMKQTQKGRKAGVSKDVVFFFQCTVGPSHTIKNDGYTIMRNCLSLSKVKEVGLVFVVPECSTDFKPLLIQPLNFDTIDSKIVIYMASFCP